MRRFLEDSKRVHIKYVATDCSDPPFTIGTLLFERDHLRTCFE